MRPCRVRAANSVSSTVAAATFARVDSSFANMLQGVILFLVLAADFYTRFKIVPVQKGGNSHGNG